MKTFAFSYLSGLWFDRLKYFTFSKVAYMNVESDVSEDCAMKTFAFSYLSGLWFDRLKYFTFSKVAYMNVESDVFSWPLNIQHWHNLKRVLDGHYSIY